MSKLPITNLRCYCLHGSSDPTIFSAAVGQEALAGRETLIVGLILPMSGIVATVQGRVDSGLSEDLTSLPARLIGLAAMIAGVALPGSLAAS